MKILSSFTQPQLKDTSKIPYNESQWGPTHNIVEVNFVVKLRATYEPAL